MELQNKTLLQFYFLYFIIRWSILSSTFLSKSLYIYNDIKKVNRYFLIDMKLNIPVRTCENLGENKGVVFFCV